jgi:hypothetical protein
VTDVNRSARSQLQINDPPQKTVIFDLFPQATLLKTIWESPEKHLKMGWTQDGQNKWLDARVAPLQKDDHEPLGHVIVLHDITEAQELLKSERRRSQQLNLLEEIGRNIADSFDEKEILQRAIDAIIQRFGYALASISVLISEETLEVKVIGGTKDFGYKPGYRQSIHEGIIGHTATTRKTYIANDVSKDPYYYSSLSTSASAPPSSSRMRSMACCTWKASSQTPSTKWTSKPSKRLPARSQLRCTGRRYMTKPSRTSTYYPPFRIFPKPYPVHWTWASSLKK